MGLSIITPHFNDFLGLRQVQKCLSFQSDKNWEWIIVDDFSDKIILNTIDKWINDCENDKIRFIKNEEKTNASVCRNIGVDNSKYDNVIFLDADDSIGNNFVLNREIQFKDFAIFPNYNVVSKKESITKKLTKSRPQLLDCYLSAQFLWQTTCVLWSKEFLINIGKFDVNLQRLQDVELFIRALHISNNYSIIDNKVDFFYNAKPIKLKQDIVEKSCDSVEYLILKLKNHYSLDNSKYRLVKSYYFACAKGLYKTEKLEDFSYIKRTLNQFYKSNYINIFEFYIGYFSLLIFKNRLISKDLFLKLNRFIFKMI